MTLDSEQLPEWWNLSDGELRARLEQRHVDLQVVHFLVCNRNLLDIADRITEYLK